MDDKKELTVKEAGRMGGAKTYEKYGKKFYSQIGKKGGKRAAELMKAGRKALKEPQ